MGSMIDSTTLPYWIIGLVIAVIVIALIIYFGLKRGKSKQVSFEKKEEKKALTQAEKSGNYHAKSGFNFAAGNSAEKEPVLRDGQKLSPVQSSSPQPAASGTPTTPRDSSTDTQPTSTAADTTAGASAAERSTSTAATKAGASIAGAAVAAAAGAGVAKTTGADKKNETAQAGDEATDQSLETDSRANAEAEQPVGGEAEHTATVGGEEQATVAEPVTPSADGAQYAETAPAAEPSHEVFQVEEPEVSPTVVDSDAHPEPDVVVEKPDTEENAAKPGSVDQVTDPDAPQPTATNMPAIVPTPGEREDHGAQALHTDEPAEAAEPEATEPPTQEEIDESAAAAAQQVEAAEAARAQEAPQASEQTVTAEPEPAEVQTEDIAPAEGRLGRLRGRLSKSNNVIGQGVLGILSAGDLDEDAWEEIEDTLIMADLGATTTMKVVDSLREKIAARGVSNEEEARAMLRETLIEAGKPELDRSIKAMPYDNKPAVVLVVGVNGTGKTTTVGKLGRVLVSMGHSVMFGAADTFRAAAADQLEAWGRRVGASTVRGKEGADPASVAFDAVAKGTEEHVDVVLVDTAGRLHTSTGLMDQLGKVKRVVEKKAKVDEVLLVLDATVGQNGIIQARTFRDVVDITGVVLTKLDGTAKGGIVFQVQEELGVPVKLVGLGEGADDLAPFEVESFVDALLY